MNKFIALAILSFFFTSIPVFAATVIGNNIQTDGTLSVTGTSTLNALHIGTPISGPSNTGDNYGLAITSNTLPYSVLEIHNKYAVGIDLYTHDDAQFRAPFINFYKSKGTQGSPGAVQYTGYELDSIGGINFGGWDGTQYFSGGASIFTQTDQNWSSTNHGAHISIYGTNNGSATDRQLAQFGGLDPNGRAGDSNNIIFFDNLAFSGLASGNPLLSPSSNPPVIKIRNGDNSAFAALSALTVQVGTSTFASIGTCASVSEGKQAAVTDSSTITWGAIITGSGANHVLAYCNGTNWTVMAK